MLYFSLEKKELKIVEPWKREKEFHPTLEESYNKILNYSLNNSEDLVKLWKKEKKERKKDFQFLWIL